MFRLLLCVAVAAMASGCKVPACQLDSTGCNCYLGVPNGVECSEARNPGTMCCAPLSWPNDSTEICKCSNPKPSCFQSDTSDFCYCGVGATAVKSTHRQVDTCVPQGDVCCLDPSSTSFSCDCNFHTTCPSALKQVSVCGTAATACATGTTRVSDCSQ